MCVFVYVCVCVCVYIFLCVHRCYPIFIPSSFPSPFLLTHLADCPQQPYEQPYVHAGAVHGVPSGEQDLEADSATRSLAKYVHNMREPAGLLWLIHIHLHIITHQQAASFSLALPLGMRTYFFAVDGLCSDDVVNANLAVVT